MTPTGKHHLPGNNAREPGGESAEDTVVSARTDPLGRSSFPRRALFVFVRTANSARAKLTGIKMNELPGEDPRRTNAPIVDTGATIRGDFIRGCSIFMRKLREIDLVNSRILEWPRRTAE